MNSTTAVKDRERAASPSPRVGAAVNWTRAIRVREWVHILPLPLATFDASVPAAIALAGAVRGVLNAAAILAFGFLVNSIADRHVDRDPRKNPFVDPRASPHRLALWALPSFSLVLAAMSPWPAQIATVFCLVLAGVYSVGPRLKAVPVLGSLLNAAGFTPILFLGMATPALPAKFGALAAAFAALLLQNQLIHEAADRVDDRASGIRTTWLTLGARSTAALAALAGIGVVAATGHILPDPLAVRAVTMISTACLFGIAVPGLLAARNLSPSRAARLRVFHRWCCLLVGAGLFLACRFAV